MTKSNVETAEITRANFGFSALVFALFGWINLEVVLLATDAGIRAHLISFALVIILSTIAYRRCGARWAPERNLTLPRNSTPGEIGSGLALVAAGCTFAYSMRTGFVTSAVICAAVLCFLPWSRMNFCRQYFFLSHALLLAGWTPFLFTASRHQDSIMMLAGTCAIWALAAGLLLATLSRQRPNRRRPDQVEVERNAHESV